jgi:metallo-beta-lactamase class B
MKKHLLRILTLTALLVLSPGGFSQPSGWVTPYPAFKVIENLYGVGTLDLSVFLITTSEGHILINTGLEDSTALIRENIESLGYRLEDISILLTMQAHWDHVAAFSEIQEISGAKIWATEKDKRILEDGGFSDPHFGGRETFRPVKVDRIIRQGDLVSLGGLELMVHEHPGHTEGSASYSFKVREGGKDYDVVIANMGTINDGKKLVVEPTYEGVSEDFAGTYRRQKEMPVDVWVAAHGSQYNLHEKYSPGQSYDPETFVDPEGFVAEIDRLEGLYLRQLSSEMAMP